MALNKDIINPEMTTNPQNRLYYILVNSDDDAITVLNDLYDNR